MNLEDLIPKFEVGERVIYHHRPIEKFCQCGRQWTDGKVFEANALIQRELDNVTAYCDHCKREYPMDTQGWYEILTEDGIEYAAPFTLLERVEVSR